MNARRNLVRIDPPEHDAMACIQCGALDVDETSTECFSCNVESVNGASISRPTKSCDIPIREQGARPTGCVGCGAVWVTKTSTVVWYFEGGLSGAACPNCAKADPATSAWQQLSDISDAIDEAMQAAADREEREMFAALIRHRAGWFSEWRWLDDDQADTAAIDAAP